MFRLIRFGNDALLGFLWQRTGPMFQVAFDTRVT